MSTIKNIWAREILDSRGNPTVEAACMLDTGMVATASVPAGASTGSHEALELRDNDQTRFGGKGVLKAVENVNRVIQPAIIGQDPSRQSEIDELLIKLDGTENKSKLGANATLAVSIAVAKLGAASSGCSVFNYVNGLITSLGAKVALKIPIPLFNMINGGLHGAGNLEFQEFFVIPVSNKGYSDGLRSCSEIYHTIGENLKRKGAIHSVGDEGGYAPNLFTNADALEVLAESAGQAGYSLGRDVLLGLDVAASTLYKGGGYLIRDRSTPLDDTGMIEYFKNLNDQYRLTVLEDPLQEDSWEGWKKITEMLGNQVVIVGDDFLVTNPVRVSKAITEKACNAVLIKPNQIGTVSETLNVIKIAKEGNFQVIVSHRSGETNDWFIADFAVGVGADYVKFGGPARGERVAKYNRLLTIEKELYPS